jgi:hypothetical protein
MLFLQTEAKISKKDHNMIKAHVSLNRRLKKPKRYNDYE